MEEDRGLITRKENTPQVVKVLTIIIEKRRTIILATTKEEAAITMKKGKAREINLSNQKEEVLDKLAAEETNSQRKLSKSNQATGSQV